MRNIIKFDQLQEADLLVDALYEGGDNGNTSDDPINKLVRGGNQAGFRYTGSPEKLELKYLSLYSSLADPEWPDYLDEQTGNVIYFGDNKKPGNALHDTPKQGNFLLREYFNLLHEGHRSKIPPIFIFTKAVKGRDVIFRGLAVPGAKGVGSTEDLVAIWKSKNGERFQNYKAIFTILDVPCVSRQWLNDLNASNPFSASAPNAWIEWVETGVYRPLMAEKTLEHRTKDEQLPTNKDDLQLVTTIYEYFDDPYKFEKCAAELFRLMEKNVVSYDLTRPWVDGGRDAIGKYRIGLEENAVIVEFALEAKRYELKNSVGVRETSRLISRIRHRQFGVLVTTSFIHPQAYKEIKEDGHPIILICAKDIVKILRQSGISNKENLLTWLEANFPKSSLE